MAIGSSRRKTSASGRRGVKGNLDFVRRPLSCEVHSRVAVALRELRRTRGLSQGALAERAGVSVSTVRRLECLHTPTRIDTLAALAGALGVPVVRLLRRSSPTVH
jgi:ribosome-binding protein aMBF1 (putative translation factor)